MPRRAPRLLVQNLAIAAAAVLSAGARLGSAPQRSGPVPAPTTRFARGGGAAFPDSGVPAAPAAAGLAGRVATALGAFAATVRPLSHPMALADAFHGYFAYRTAHPEGTKPLLYFVDYGLPSTEPRGYVFDMDALRVVEGPFPVAHGRGSSGGADPVPRRFSNAFGSAATSLGLYVAQELYPFVGHAGRGSYASLGMRLEGVSDGFNDNARARRVVAHGAPYVTDAKAGRSEGCPALAPERAARLLPKLAEGGLVFLFAPDPEWMARDPWVNAPAEAPPAATQVAARAG